MRTLRAVVALTGLVLAVNGLETGKELEYSYSGSLEYEIPERHGQHSMLMFRAKVVGQKLDDNKFAVLIKDMEISSHNEKNKVHHYYGKDKDTEMPGPFKRNEQLSQSLEKPFILNLKMENGNLRFSNMETHVGDPIWSLNIKKGLVSFMNVFIPNEDKHIYHSMESTIQGDCQVYWNIQHLPHFTNPDAKVMNVSRVVDLEKCSAMSGKVYGPLRAQPCVNCESVNTHPLQQLSRGYYQILSPSGNRKDVIIEKGHGHSEVIHAPYTENGHVTRLVMEQDVNLLGTRDATTKLAIEGQPEVHTNLNMIFTKDNRFKRTVDMKAANDWVAEWNVVIPVELVVSQFKELSLLQMDEENQVGVFDKKDPAQALSHLLDSMQSINYEQTEKIFTEVVKPAEEAKQEKMQSMFVDVVAHAGHNAGIQLLMDKFTSGEISPKFLKNFFLALTRGIKEPTETAVNAIWDFCNSEVVKASRTARAQCMMTYTTIISETCRLAMFAPPYADKECQGQKLQNEAFQKAVPEYDVAKQHPMMMDAYIHMAINLRTHKAVEFLAKIFHDSEMDTFTRMDAGRGLIIISPLHGEFLREKVAEIFLDTKQPYELRMLASVAMFKTHPPLSMLHAMVARLRYEKSDQLTSFIVSMVKAVDKQEHPCFKPLAQHIRYIAPEVAALFPKEWNRKDRWSSHVHMSAGYDATYDFGGHSIGSIIMSPDSYLPRELHFSSGDYYANFFYENVALNFRQTGMDKITDMMKSPLRTGKVLGKSLWNFMGLRRPARSAASNKQEVEDLDEKLHIKPKQYDPMRMEFTVSAFGHDIFSMKMNNSHFEKIFTPDYKPGTLFNQWLAKGKDVNRFLTMRDLTFMIPTSFGLPAFLMVRLPAVYSHKRKESSFTFENDGTMNFKLNRRIMYDGHLHEAFSVGVPFENMHFGVGFDKRVAVNLPLNVDISANLMTGKMQLNKDFLLPRDLLNYHFKPYTFVESWSHPENNNALPYYDDKELHKFNHDVWGDFSGVAIKVGGHRLPDESVWTDVRKWYFNSDWRAKIYYWMANPKWNPRKLDIRFEPHTSNPSTAQTVDFAYKFAEPEQGRPPSKFEEFTKDLDHSFVHVLNIEDSLKGEKERKAMMEIRYSHNPQRTEHWFQMFHSRTPFSSKEHDMTKMCMVAKMKQTVTDWSKLNKEEVVDINEGQHMDIMMDINYGKNCKTGAEIHANIHYEHSQEQKDWMKEIKTGEFKGDLDANPYRHLHEVCIKYLAKGMDMPYFCHKYIIHTSQLNKMTVDIGYDNVKLLENPLLSTVYTRLKSRYYPYLWLHMMKGNNSTPGRIHMESTVHEPCRFERLVDVKYEGPHHTSVWKGVPVSKGAHWAPRTATHMGQTNLISYSNKFYHRYCDMQMNYVRTFDEIYYKIPESTCYSVVAKDCSPQKVFTLLAKDNAEKNKELLVYIDTYKLEITRTGEKAILKLDSVEEELINKKPKLIKNERDVTILSVILLDSIVLIESNVYGIYFGAYGNSVYVQAATYYRGKMCGLCGDYNLDRQHEFHTTDGCHHNTAWAYARNYMVPDATCTVPEPDPMAGTPHCGK